MAGTTMGRVLGNDKPRAHDRAMSRVQWVAEHRLASFLGAWMKSVTAGDNRERRRGKMDPFVGQQRPSATQLESYVESLVRDGKAPPDFMVWWTERLSGNREAAQEVAERVATPPVSDADVKASLTRSCQGLAAERDSLDKQLGAAREEIERLKRAPSIRETEMRDEIRRLTNERNAAKTKQSEAEYRLLGMVERTDAAERKASDLAVNDSAEAIRLGQELAVAIDDAKRARHLLAAETEKVSRARAEADELRTGYQRVQSEMRMLRSRAEERPQPVPLPVAPPALAPAVHHGSDAPSLLETLVRCGKLSMAEALDLARTTR